VSTAEPSLAPDGLARAVTSPGLARDWNLPLVLGAVGCLLFVVASLAAPWLAPYGPEAINTLHRLQPAQAAHLLGTDEYGRDTLSRLLFGGRVSLLVSAIAVTIGSVGGAAVGMVAGYAGGRFDGLLMRLMDLLFSFPVILLAVLIMALLGSSLQNAMIAIGVIFIPGFARFTRSLTRSVMVEPYIAYAQSTGVPPLRILVRDVLPNVLPGLAVQATVAVGYAVMLESTLSFLGLGAQPPTPSWGNMIDAGRGYMGRAPLMVVAPVLAIFFVVLSTNMLGDGLQLKRDRQCAQGRT
jgi:ABC-type dipeptide/oligopeptide/nickel transport system permease subunit